MSARGRGLAAGRGRGVGLVGLLDATDSADVTAADPAADRVVVGSAPRPAALRQAATTVRLGAVPRGKSGERAAVQPMQKHSIEPETVSQGQTEHARAQHGAPAASLPGRGASSRGLGVSRGRGLSRILGTGALAVPSVSSADGYPATAAGALADEATSQPALRGGARALAPGRSKGRGKGVAALCVDGASVAMTAAEAAADAQAPGASPAASAPAPAAAVTVEASAAAASALAEIGEAGFAEPFVAAVTAAARSYGATAAAKRASISFRCLRTHD
jgi:hypothetical protein